MTTTFTKTLRIKVKPNSWAWLKCAAVEVNQVWNWANETSAKAARPFTGRVRPQQFVRRRDARVRVYLRRHRTARVRRMCDTAQSIIALTAAVLYDIDTL